MQAISAIELPASLAAISDTLVTPLVLGRISQVAASFNVEALFISEFAEREGGHF